MDHDNGYSPEKEFYEKIMMKIIALDELDESSDDDSEDGFKIFDDARATHAGSAGTARFDRAAPRPFIPAANGVTEVRRHFGMDGEWGRIFF